MSALELVVAVLLLLGSLLTLIAAVGLVRFPDVFTRMSAASKAGTLGATLVLAGYGVAFAEIGLDARVLAAVVFLVLSTPVGAHVVGRSAHGRAGAVWSGTQRDDLRAYARRRSPVSPRSTRP